MSDAEGSYLNRPSQRKPLSVSDTCPAKLVTWHPVIPNGSYPLDGPRQNPPRVRLVSWCLGTQIGLGRGRQNERDLVMVEDPLIDFEEVVVGMRSLGSNPMARRDISSGSSSLRSPSKLRARWGLIPIEPTQLPGSPAP